MSAGYVGLIGLPNSGKSTLVNALVGEKISIVTAKPQTTRKRILGVVNWENDLGEHQAVFMDSPGVTESSSGLNPFLQREYKAVMDESNLLLCVLNLDEKDPKRLVKMIEMVRESKKPWAVVITKSDLNKRDRMSYLMAETIFDNVPVATISALENPKGARNEILKLCEQFLPKDAPKFYDDEDLFTTSTVKDLASEFIREACFEELNEEIPYSLGVIIRGFEEKERVTVIVADILVEKESHRQISIGQNGQKIKAIGMKSRQSIEKLLGQKTFLELHVVAKNNWIHNPQYLKDMGYVATS